MYRYIISSLYLLTCAAPFSKSALYDAKTSTCYKPSKQAQKLLAIQDVLSPDECQNIVVFLEDPTRFPKDTSRYFRKTDTKLACDVEYDQKTGLSFIHLDKKAPLGQGFYKLVSQSILYNGKKSSIVARAIGCKCCLEKDLKWVDIANKIDRFAKVITVCEHPTYKGEHILNKRHPTKRIRETQSIIYQYYNGGSLSAIKTDYNLSLVEKVSIACDLARAVKELHDQGVVHFDIKPGNILLNKKRNRIEAVLTDLGGSTFISEVSIPRKNGHGTFMYTPPEGFLQETLQKATIITACDIYGLGCCFYTLFHENQAPWALFLRKMRVQNASMGQKGVKEKCFTPKNKRTFLNIIQNTRKKLLSSSKNDPSLQKINELIFEMLSEEQKDRPSACSVYNRLQKIQNQLGS